MAVLAQINNIRKKSNQYLKKHIIIKFALLFSFAFSILLFAPNSIQNIPNKAFIGTAGYFIDKYANRVQNPTSYSIFEYNDETQTAVLITTYYKPILNQPVGTQKNMTIYIELEYYLPLILLISLVFATDNKLKKKILNVVISSIFLSLYLAFKLIAISFDNYNYPETAITEISGFIGGIVYYFNYFLNITGASLNIVLPIIIWLIIFLYQSKEINILTNMKIE